MKSLTEDLDYTVSYSIVDSSNLVPQHRERIYIVGFRDPTQFSFPELEDRRPVLRDILEDIIPDKYIISDPNSL